MHIAIVPTLVKSKIVVQFILETSQLNNNLKIYSNSNWV